MAERLVGSAKKGRRLDSPRRVSLSAHHAMDAFISSAQIEILLGHRQGRSKHILGFLVFIKHKTWRNFHGRLFLYYYNDYSMFFRL